MTPINFIPNNDLCRMSAGRLAEGIRLGEFTSVEVTEAHIRRIEETHKDLNAVVVPLFEAARAAAEEADRKTASGEPLGALHGVPVTIKEQYMVAGTATTLGVRRFAGTKHHREGPLVSALREAGAIILGKTNVLQTLAGWETDNPLYGRTHNPWNLDRTPGGSSGGESTIIAAGGSALGLAGDLGGSIRIPAHFCGVHGLKPTARRLTNMDFPPGLLSGGQEAIIPQPGPIARTVADLERAMTVFTGSGRHPTADRVPPVPWRGSEGIRIDTLRIGFYSSSPFFPAAPSVRRAVEEAAEALQNLGADVVPFDPPDMAEGTRLFLAVLSAAQGLHYKRLLGPEKPVPQVVGTLNGLSNPKAVLAVLSRLMAARGQSYLSHIMASAGVRSAAAYWDLVEECNAFRYDHSVRLQEEAIDAVLCPPFATPAFPHGANGDLFPAGCYASVYNVLGNPAGVVSISRVRPDEETDRPDSRDQAVLAARRAELGSTGLPLGVQVVGRDWREDVVLAVMRALEAEFSARLDFPLRGFEAQEVERVVMAPAAW